MINRRQFAAASTGAIAALATKTSLANSSFQPRYLLGSCMYGYSPVAEIVPEVAKCGASAIDIWPKVHGNQREQLDDMGEEKFAELLREHNIRLGCITQYKLGPFGLQDEMQLAKRLGCRTIVTGGKGPRGLSGSDLKDAVKDFLKKMKPHIAVAKETGVRIALENHANNLIESPDSLRYIADLAPKDAIGIAFAPYHLPQDPQLLAKLITDLGDSLEVFYAWQHGKGCMTKLPKEDELLQMPGRGDLDFRPILDALSEIKFDGWTEIFMHPFPRGIPILETTAEVTEEINRAREYLGSL